MNQGVRALGSTILSPSSAEMGKKVALVNRGKTRADDLAHVKVEGDCGDVLQDLVGRMNARG